MECGSLKIEPTGLIDSTINMEPEIIEEEVTPEEPILIEISATVYGKSDLN